MAPTKLKVLPMDATVLCQLPSFSTLQPTGCHNMFGQQPGRGDRRAANKLQPTEICESHAQSTEHRAQSASTGGSCGPSTELDTTRHHLHSLAVGNGARGINKMLFMDVICKQRLPFVTGNCRWLGGGGKRCDYPAKQLYVEASLKQDEPRRP